ncbi:MAG TPA: hypothetical protein VL961_06645 [Acidimicrobiales bacterium]|nr:hypothetical protein [Acidimicrobiales bacterium]
MTLPALPTQLDPVLNFLQTVCQTITGVSSAPEQTAAAANWTLLDQGLGSWHLGTGLLESSPVAVAPGAPVLFLGLDQGTTTSASLAQALHWLRIYGVTVVPVLVPGDDPGGFASWVSSALGPLAGTVQMAAIAVPAPASATDPEADLSRDLVAGLASAGAVLPRTAGLWLADGVTGSALWSTLAGALAADPPAFVATSVTTCGAPMSVAPLDTSDVPVLAEGVGPTTGVAAASAARCLATALARSGTPAIGLWRQDPTP